MVQLSALTNQSTKISQFDQPIRVSLSYNPSDLGNLNESELTIYRYDNGQWQALSNCSVNTNSHTVTCTTNNFSVFGLFACQVAPTTTVAVTSTTASTTTTACSHTPPSSAPDLFQINANSQTAKLHLAPAAGEYDRYSITYGPKNNPQAYAVLFSQFKSQGAIVFTVSALKPNTEYHFRVRAENGCAVGEWSRELIIRTNRKKKQKEKIFYKETFIAVNTEALFPSQNYFSPSGGVSSPKTTKKIPKTNSPEILPKNKPWYGNLKQFLNKFKLF